MNKRALSKIERPLATEEMFHLAERIGGDKYIATSKNIDVDGEKILLLNFFLRSQLIKKNAEAVFRTFISKSDYITQDLTTTRVKWKTGSFQSILGWYYWNTKKKGHDVTFASDSDFDNVRFFMKAYLDGKTTNVWDAIWKFQNEILDKRLKERHKKETDPIDAKMEMVPPKPDGFDKWAHDFAMGDKRYLVYEAPGKKRETIGYCTHCKKMVVIDAQAVRPRNKKRGICPSCNSPVTFIPKGYFPTYQRDSKWVCLIQEISTGIVARYFHVFQEISRNEQYEEDFYIGELCRAFFEKTDMGDMKLDSYEWGVYKQHGLPRWCPDFGHQNCADAVVYTGNLPEVFKGTIYQYCALDLYQKKRDCNPIPVWRFMKKYPSLTYLEMFLKSGLVNLAGEIVNGHDYELNTDGKTPVEILGIPKNYIPILREIDGDCDDLCLLRQCEADKIFPLAKDINEFHQRFGGNDELLGVIHSHMSMRKFINYMDKQRKILPKHKETPCCATWGYSRNYSKEDKEKEAYKNLSNDWLDYISWCAKLKYNLKDMYVLLPPNFGKAHDRVMKEYQAFENEQERKRQAKMEKLIKETLAAAGDLPAMMMKAKGLMIVLPKSGEEIKEEGKVLHHCVGTYVERVAKGETMILFVRKESEPNVPYFTLEYRDGKVVQCRGMHNCDMTKNVQAFTKAFERKMQEDEKKPAKKNRKAG